ncbi:MAG: zinc ribbon domain-containing protein [Synergistaceae bacterium]|jgi:ribosomal protein L40E|nr:zinc ribbon domain-containing protein [Synergistaceae bacterium]
MELFDRIGSMTKAAVDKTANKVIIARINSKISTFKSGIGVQKLKIGEYYWSKHRDGKSFDPSVADAFSAIESYLAQIESCESEIRVIIESEQAVRIVDGEYGKACLSCGARNSLDAKFCHDCGLPVNGAAVSAGAVRCANCGAEMEGDAIFCGECGTKLQGGN